MCFRYSRARAERCALNGRLLLRSLFSLSERARSFARLAQSKQPLFYKGVLAVRSLLCARRAGGPDTQRCASSVFLTGRRPNVCFASLHSARFLSVGGVDSRRFSCLAFRAWQSCSGGRATKLWRGSGECALALVGFFRYPPVKALVPRLCQGLLWTKSHLHITSKKSLTTRTVCGVHTSLSRDGWACAGRSVFSAANTTLLL